MLSSRDCGHGHDPIELRQTHRVALLAAFVWAGIAMGTTLRSGDPEQQKRELTLSQSTPEAVFPLDDQRVKKGETTVLVRLVRADNPDHADFTVTAVLVDCRGGAESQSVAVGSLGVYPTGTTGGSYAMDLGPGLKQMGAARHEPGQICLKLQLKPLRPSVDWKKLRVTVMSPEWKEPPKS